MFLGLGSSMTLSGLTLQSGGFWLAAGGLAATLAAVGTGGLRRLRLGSARIRYEVDDTRHAVHVLTVGPAGG